MHRFFIPPEWIDHDRVVITGHQAHQLKEVLRIRAGDLIAVMDNTGLEYRVEIVDITSQSVSGIITERYPCPNEPGIEIILYQAILKGNKFDFVLQKCTEIGIAGIVPIICERCVAGKPSSSRIDRWQKIIVEAAEQSGRGKLPVLNSVLSFEQACKKADGFSLIPWEAEKTLGIKSAIRDAGTIKRVNILIGPEGGFSQGEVEFARIRGIIPITLGRRVLRAETAGIVTSAAILCECGELGG